MQLNWCWLGILITWLKLVSLSFRQFVTDKVRFTTKCRNWNESQRKVLILNFQFSINAYVFFWGGGLPFTEGGIISNLRWDLVAKWNFMKLIFRKISIVNLFCWDENVIGSHRFICLEIYENANIFLTTFLYFPLHIFSYHASI